MTITELLKKHGIENKELEDSLEMHINNELAREHDHMVPKERIDLLVSQRNSLKADLSEKDGELASIKAKLEKIGNVDELQAKNQELQEYVYKMRLDEWQQKANVFTSDDEAMKKKIEKIKDDFVLSEELTLEQIENNLKSYQRYDKIDFFKADDSKPDFNSTPPTRQQPGQTKSTEELILEKFKKFGG